LRGALDMTLAQVCLSIFLPLFLLFHFPLILLCSFVVCPPPVENERIELMIGCFESG
jgi:hypothetical protein